MLVAGSVQLRKGPTEIVEAPLPAIVRNYRCANSKLRDRLAFTPQVSVTESIETTLDAIERWGMKDFDNPYYYNIGWMTQLERMFDSLKPFDSVF